MKYILHTTRYIQLYILLVLVKFELLHKQIYFTIFKAVFYVNVQKMRFYLENMQTTKQKKVPYLSHHLMFGENHDRHEFLLI